MREKKKLLIKSFVFELDFGEIFILISNDTCNDTNKSSLSAVLNIYMATLYNTISLMLANILLLSNMSIQCIKYIHYSITLKITFKKTFVTVFINICLMLVNENKVLHW